MNRWDRSKKSAAIIQRDLRMTIYADEQETMIRIIESR